MTTSLARFTDARPRLVASVGRISTLSCAGSIPGPVVRKSRLALRTIRQMKR